MRDIQTQVLGITSKSTRTGEPMFSLQLANGETVTTFETAEATKAAQSGGQPVALRINDVVKGDKTYHNLVAIALVSAGESLPAEIPAAGTPVALGTGALQITQAPAFNGKTNGGGNRGMSEADKVRITKLAALSTAYGFVGHLLSGGVDYETAVEMAEQLAKKLYNDARSHEQAAKDEGLAQVGLAVQSAQNEGLPIQVGTEGVVAEPVASGLPWG